MKHIFLRYFRFSFALVVLTLVGCNSSSKKKVYLEEENKAKTDLDIGLVYYNELHLQLVKKRIKEKDSYFNNKIMWRTL